MGITIKLGIFPLVTENEIYLMKVAAGGIRACLFNTLVIDSRDLEN